MKLFEALNGCFKVEIDVCFGSINVQTSRQSKSYRELAEAYKNAHDEEVIDQTAKMLVSVFHSSSVGNGYTIITILSRTEVPERIIEKYKPVAEQLWTERQDQ